MNRHVRQKLVTTEFSTPRVSDIPLICSLDASQIVLLPRGNLTKSPLEGGRLSLVQSEAQRDVRSVMKVAYLRFHELFRLKW